MIKILNNYNKYMMSKIISPLKEIYSSIKKSIIFDEDD